MLLLAFGVFVVAALTASGLYVNNMRGTLLQQRTLLQTAVTNNKAQQVEKWLFERKRDVQRLAAALKQLKHEVSAYTFDDRQIVSLLFAEILAKNPETTDASLFAADGKVISHVGATPAPSPEATEAALAMTRSPPTTPLVIVLNANERSALRVAFALPIAGHAPGGNALPVLVISVDPSVLLFPQLDAETPNTQTIETLVVRRDGDEVVYVMPPAGMKPAPAPGTYSVPVSNSSLAAVQAVLQGNGVREGHDYAGVPVLSASRSIAGLPWILVTKTNISEIVLPLTREMAEIVVLTAMSIFLGGLIIGLLWIAQRNAFFGQQARFMRERLALVRHFQDMVQQADEIVFLSNSDGYFIEASEAAQRTYGYSAEEFRKMNSRDIRAPEERANFDIQFPEILSGAGKVFETVHRRKDGSTFVVESRNGLIQSKGKPYIQTTIHDITQRKAAEREIARLSNVKVALQAATSVLLRARSETKLFQEMCAILVQQGGYRMVNVAVPNSDIARTVRYLAIAGINDGYLSEAAISWGEGPLSRGPTGTALRTGELQVLQNLADNSEVTPWRAKALKQGFNASISLPLKADGRVFAALTLYAERPNAFDVEETALLVVLAEDISYAVLRLRDRT